MFRRTAMLVLPLIVLSVAGCGQEESVDDSPDVQQSLDSARIAADELEECGFDAVLCHESNLRLVEQISDSLGPTPPEPLGKLMSDFESQVELLQHDCPTPSGCGIVGGAADLNAKKIKKELAAIDASDLEESN